MDIDTFDVDAARKLSEGGADEIRPEFLVRQIRAKAKQSASASEPLAFPISALKVIPPNTVIDSAVQTLVEKHGFTASYDPAEKVIHVSGW